MDACGDNSTIIPSHRLEGGTFEAKLEQVVQKSRQSNDKSDKRNELRPEQT